MDKVQKAEAQGPMAQVFQQLRFQRAHQSGVPKMSLPPSLVNVGEMPGPASPLDRVTLPVTTLHDITRSVPLDMVQKQAVERLVQDNQDNEVQFRGQLMSYCHEQGFEPALRRELLDRAVSWYKQHGRAQGNAARIRARARGVTPDEVPMQVDMVKAAGGHKYLKREGTPGNYRYTYPDDPSRPTVRVRAGGKGETAEVAIKHRKGLYAVHEQLEPGTAYTGDGLPYRAKPAYNVTHVPSGFKVGQRRTLADAVTMAAHLDKELGGTGGGWRTGMAAWEVQNHPEFAELQCAVQALDAKRKADKQAALDASYAQHLAAQEAEAAERAEEARKPLWKRGIVDAGYLSRAVNAAWDMVGHGTGESSRAKREFANGVDFGAKILASDDKVFPDPGRQGLDKQLANPNMDARSKEHLISGHWPTLPEDGAASFLENLASKKAGVAGATQEALRTFPFWRGVHAMGLSLRAAVPEEVRAALTREARDELRAKHGVTPEALLAATDAHRAREDASVMEFEARRAANAAALATALAEKKAEDARRETELRAQWAQDATASPAPVAETPPARPLSSLPGVGPQLVTRGPRQLDLFGKGQRFHVTDQDMDLIKFLGPTPVPKHATVPSPPSGHAASWPSGHGEGSHGGHVVGHTKSGKPIYAHGVLMARHNLGSGHGTKGQVARHKVMSTHYANFTEQDHKDAAAWHREQEWKIPHTPSEKAQKDYHGTMRREHTDAARRAHVKEHLTRSQGAFHIRVDGLRKAELQGGSSFLRDLAKAVAHKYLERKGTPGNYVYTYPDKDSASRRTRGLAAVAEAEHGDGTIPLHKLGIHPASPREAQYAASIREDKDKWADAPIHSVHGGSTFHGTETHVKAKHVGPVARKEVPLREGYEPQLLRKRDGTFVVVDGHHRMAMHQALGTEHFDAKVLDMPAEVDDTAEGILGEVSADTVTSLAKLIAAGKLSGTPEHHLHVAKAALSQHSAKAKEFESMVAGVAPPKASVSSRVKTLDSAAGKLARDPSGGAIDKLHDLTGARIVLDNLDDVKSTVDKIKGTFKISWEGDYINSPKGDYRSHHLIVEHDGLRKEIQVRTKRQDVFANWCHDVYKPRTPSQQRLVQKARAEIDAYSHAASDYLHRKDTGAPTDPPSAPPCPVVLERSSFGCMRVQ